jgi:Ni/Fe-hydrogenase subunit HybB-like protein
MSAVLDRPAPLGGPVLTKGTRVLVVLAAIGVAAMVYRFVAGLGGATALNDGYPWGLWIAFDVVTGTALGCGGYAVALLVYVLNKGEFHPLVRPALLTSALGYSLAAVSILLDVGRPWLLHRVAIYVNHWNTSSALFEVALCVMTYVAVLWIEVSPSFLATWKKGPPGLRKSLGDNFLPVIEKALPFVIALGLLLPTMHQSSLGTLMLLSGKKLHGLWSTPLLPLLFLISCLAMGYAVVVFESTLSSIAFRRPREGKMLAGLGQASSRSCGPGPASGSSTSRSAASSPSSRSRTATSSSSSSRSRSSSRPPSCSPRPRSARTPGTCSGPRCS